MQDTPAETTTAPTNGTISPEEKAKRIRERVSFARNVGEITLAMIALTRYRHLPIDNLKAMVLEPLMRNRIALARQGSEAPDASPVVGFAIWATVSEECDARIREQVKDGVFPINLKREDWTGGDIHWLLDVVAPNRKTATVVVSQLRQLIGEHDLNLHPTAAGQIDHDAKKVEEQASGG